MKRTCGGVQRETKARQQLQITARSRLRERRLQSARVRKYYDEYQVRQRSRMLKKRTKEELVRTWSSSGCVTPYLLLISVHFFVRDVHVLCLNSCIYPASNIGCVLALTPELLPLSFSGCFPGVYDVRFGCHMQYRNTRLTAVCPGLSGSACTRKVKPIWILLKQETVSGSGISWAICKPAPCSRQITTPAPHHSVFYRPDALPAAQPTASKH